MWETKCEGGCPSQYEVLVLLGRQAGGGVRVFVRSLANSRVPAARSQAAVHGSRSVRTRSGLHLCDVAVLVGGGGPILAGDLRSALPLPHVSPEICLLYTSPSPRDS